MMQVAVRQAFCKVRAQDESDITVASVIESANDLPYSQFRHPRTALLEGAELDWGKPELCSRELAVHGLPGPRAKDPKLTAAEFRGGGRIVSSGRRHPAWAST
jgi:hypothetical protein